jgi:hypothetical protein
VAEVARRRAKEAAMTAGEGECDSHQSAAERHRAAAAAHEATVTQLTSEKPFGSSADFLGQQ